LRSALRAGNIGVAHSRRYANPDTYLIPPAEWPRWRPEVIRQTGIPSEGATRLAECEAELEHTMAEVEWLLARKDSHVRVEKDEIVLSPLEADPRRASADTLAARITERLPRVQTSTRHPGSVPFSMKVKATNRVRILFTPAGSLADHIGSV
jgi:hypothetical protein